MGISIQGIDMIKKPSGKMVTLSKFVVDIAYSQCFVGLVSYLPGEVKKFNTPRIG
jgi:hypothetical protein